MPENTVVMITGSSISKDSRTYKEALSLVRFGYRCIVLEGEKSDLDLSKLPFELRTFGRPRSKSSPKFQATAPHSSAPRAVSNKRGLKQWFPGWLRHAFPLGRYLFRLLRYNWTIRKQIPKASLYYLHYFDFFPAVYWRAKRCGAPLIYDAHDCHALVKPSETLTDFQRLYQKPLQQRLESLCVNRAHSFITVCQGVANLHTQMFNRTPSIIRNCHDFRLDGYGGAKIKKRLNLTPAQFLIVVVGTAKPGMSFEALFIALRGLPPQVHVAFIGSGYEAYCKGPHYEAVRSRIHAPGAVKPYEVVPFIQDAEAALILYTSHTENYHHCLPNGFFQSLSAGLPLLYPKLPEIDRLASQYRLGIAIDPADPHSIQEGVQSLLNSPNDQKQYRTNCQHAATELSWEREEHLLRHIIERAMH